MKKALIVIFTFAIVSLGAGANAQVPYVQVSFDEFGTRYSQNCPSVQVFDTLTVWVGNFDMWVSAIEYAIDYGSSVAHVADIMIGDALQIGDSPTGITIGYPSPCRAYGLFATQRIAVFWLCTNCLNCTDNEISVIPHPSSGKIRAVNWFNLAIVDAIGMTSIICPSPRATQFTTWGAVKSLYDD